MIYYILGDDEWCQSSVKYYSLFLDRDTDFIISFAWSISSSLFLSY